MWLLLSNLDTHNSDADEQRKFVLPLLAQVTSEQLRGLVGPGARSSCGPRSEVLPPEGRQIRANRVRGVSGAAPTECRP